MERYMGKIWEQLRKEKNMVKMYCIKNLIIKKTTEAVNTVHHQTTTTPLHLLPAVHPHSAFYSVDSINC